jgi:hypothetical protein
MMATDARVIGKCTNGHVVNTTDDQQHRGGAVRCACGAEALIRFMKVRVIETRACNGVCMGSTGPSCDCSCGGRNHGKNHAAG